MNVHNITFRLCKALHPRHVYNLALANKKIGTIKVKIIIYWGA